MIRLVAVAFALALAPSAQAIPLAPLHPDDMVTTVREACGAGFHRVAGVCVRTPAPLPTQNRRPYGYDYPPGYGVDIGFGSYPRYHGGPKY